MEQFYLPEYEINKRIKNLQAALQYNNLDGALIAGRMNLFYLTGTIVNAMLFVEPEGQPKLFVRKSLYRTKLESPIKEIYPMKSIGDITAVIGDCSGKKIGLEFMRITLQVSARLSKRIKADFQPIDSIMVYIRSKKSDYEISLLKRAGELQKELHENIIPKLIRAGKTEKQLAADILKSMFYGEHDGICRMNAFEQEITTPTIVSGKGGKCYSVFDGTPGGGWGICPASPFFGSPLIKIEKNSPIMVDILYGYQGYKTDKSTTYSIGNLSGQMTDAHQFCIDMRDYIADRLHPGEIPSSIYESVLAKEAKAGYEKIFMGQGESQVHFVGHGIGLAIDEYPVLAKRFDEPLEKSMVIAVEPKIVFDEGVVGLEDTYLVGDNGGEILNGQDGKIIVI
ncbi:MAG: peptidase M24 [bacterium]|nr:MAG: peptidase M24 [bacterium]